MRGPVFKGRASAGLHGEDGVGDDVSVGSGGGSERGPEVVEEGAVMAFFTLGCGGGGHLGEEARFLRAHDGARDLQLGRPVAVKVLFTQFANDPAFVERFRREAQAAANLNHPNIVNIIGWGSDGTVKKPSGREIKNLVYILLENVTGGLLFDVCQTIGGMGENGGRYFLSQMLDVMEYMHGKGVVHRDLKLENILVDDFMNLKVADFGFATFRKIHNLKSYRGTMTYMAPEIKENKNYDGIQIDLFSTAVILFIIV